MISKSLEKAINEQIVNELYSSNAYLSIASYMDSEGLKVLSAYFFKQSQEERTHAIKLLRYLLDVSGNVAIGQVPAPPLKFKSVEHAVKVSLDQEQTVTGQINNLMGLSHKENDYATASFLKWFVDEQVEELSSMNELLLLVQKAGEVNLLLVEDRLLKQGVQLAKPGAGDGEGD